MDVAHLMKNICGWSAFKDVPLKVKDFYMRAVGLVIMSTSLAEAESFILSIFVIGLAKTEGNNGCSICNSMIVASRDRGYKKCV